MAKLRVWKLGSLEKNLLPTKNAIQKLKDILKDWDHKSDFDLIWGPELFVEEYEILPLNDKDFDIVTGPNPKITIIKDTDNSATIEIEKGDKHE